MTFKPLIVVAVVLAFAWLVVRTAVVGVAATAAPTTALAVAPGNPVALIGSADYMARAPRPPSAGQIATLDRAARTDPLYLEPYLAKASLVGARGDTTRAIRLAEVAQSRDPRNQAVHLFLLQHYARAGDIKAAVAQMGPLVALAGQAGPALANALGVLAQTAEGQRVIGAALHTNPTWRSAFIGQAGPASEGLAFRTLVNSPASIGAADRQRDQQSFLERLIQRGDYQRAYLAWVNFLPRSASNGVQAIYDGNFAGMRGPLPFNWALTSNEVASAERRSDSSLPGRTALDVNFFGSDAAVIATQTLFVQPGSYVFRMIGSADGGGQFAGSLHWQLGCIPSGARFPLATVDRFDGRAVTFQHPITIPQTGCDAQQLSLSGDPGEVSTLIHAQFTGLRLVPR